MKGTAARKALAAKEQADIVAAIRRGLESIRRGDSIPARKAIESLRRKHKSSRK